MTLYISDAMKNGIKDVKKHKLTYSPSYIEQSKKITEQIEEDHRNYTCIIERASKVYVY